MTNLASESVGVCGKMDTIKFAAIFASILLFRYGVNSNDASRIIVTVNLLAFLTLEFPLDVFDYVVLSNIYILSCYFVLTLDALINSFVKPLIKKTNKLFTKALDDVTQKVTQEIGNEESDSTGNEEP